MHFRNLELKSRDQIIYDVANKNFYKISFHGIQSIKKSDFLKNNKNTIFILKFFHMTFK